MPNAICDSSTLIHLARIGRLHLLREFHKKIFIAPAVWREVVEEGREWPGSSEVEELRKDLHDGESETIALAVELDPDIIFLDESEARKTAGVYGLKISGVIGILIRAKREGRISSLRDELDRLRIDAGFWIGDEIYRKALRFSGEDLD